MMSQSTVQSVTNPAVFEIFNPDRIMGKYAYHKIKILTNFLKNIIVTEATAKEAAAGEVASQADAITKKVDDLTKARVKRQEKMTCKDFSTDVDKFGKLELNGTAAEIKEKLKPFEK